MNGRIDSRRGTSTVPMTLWALGLCPTEDAYEAG